MMKRKYRNLVVMFIPAMFFLLPSLSMAQEQKRKELPDRELIEFLGEFEDEDVGWVDPFALFVLEDERVIDNREDGGADEHD